jgi:hypothetical protein
MVTIEECHKNAEECLRWATGAKTEAERKVFLDMARTWTEAAAMLDGDPSNIAKHLPSLNRKNPTPPSDMSAS